MHIRSETAQFVHYVTLMRSAADQPSRDLRTAQIMFHSPEISQVCLILDGQFQDFGVLCNCVRCVHPPANKVTRLSVSKNRNQDQLSELHHRDWLHNFSPYLWLTTPSEMTCCTNYPPTGTIPSCTLWFMHSCHYPCSSGRGIWKKETTDSRAKPASSVASEIEISTIISFFSYFSTQPSFPVT